MIDDEEQTTQRPTSPGPSQDEPAATIQVTPIHAPAANIAPLPFMDSEDLLSLKVVSDPQISPNGELIAFTLLTCNADRNTTSSAIWLANSKSTRLNPPRQVSSGEAHDTQPRWSPDGRWLAFLSDRSGTPQIYVLSLQGGEARQISFLKQGVTEYSWRYDSQILLAHSAWKPEDEHDDEHAESDTRLYTRLGGLWDGKGDKKGRYQQLWLLPLEGSALRLTSEPVDLEQSCWSPDGTEIVFCANRRSDPDLSVSMALWVLTVSTGQMRRLTPEEGLAQVPAWSPDGQSIAYLYTPDQTEAGNMSPYLVSAQGDTLPRPAVTDAEQLTCQTWIIDELRDEWLAPPVWYSDSKALLIPVQERGQVHLYRLELEAGTATRLTSGNGRYVSPQISRDGTTVAMVRADWFTPGDIWGMDSDGKNLRKLSKVNDAILQSHQLVRPKRITWKSFDDLEIEGWLYLPPVPEGKKVPLILAPHGGPTLAWGDGYVHEFQVMAGHGYAILAPNPRGSAGYGEAFSRKILNDWGGADFQDLMAGIDYVLATEQIDENRLGVSGMSYGGYMTNWTLTQTQRFKAGVSRNGISSLPNASLLSDQTIWFKLSMPDDDLQRQRSPLTFADQIHVPLLLLHPEEDLRCPFSESKQLFVYLHKRKQPVELVGYRGTSHLMDWPQVGAPLQRVDRLRRTVAWFERFL